jgi:hypothetical protein
MTAPKPKHHDFDDAERWMQDDFGMKMSTYIRIGQAFPLELATFETVRLFDRACIRARIERWKAEDRTSDRGRKALMSETSVLMLMFITMRARRSVSIQQMTEVAMSLTTSQREAIGILKFTPHQDTLYRRIWEAIKRLRKLIDRHPGPRRNTMTDAERAAAIAELRDPVEMAKRAARMLELTNQLIEGSVQFLNREVRRRFKGAIAIDATFAEVSGKQKSARNIKPGDKVSTNYDCGWYGRQGSHDPDQDGGDKYAFGWELEYAVMTRDPNETEASYPLLFLSTSGHKPGALTGHGLFLYQSAVERGHAIKTVVGDRAYFPGAKPEDLQRPLAQAGVKVVMDYKNDEEELGQQAFYASADGRHNLVMVTGSWHMRFMPAALIDAEKTYLDYLKTITSKPGAERSKLRDEAHALLRQRRKERSRYRLIPRSGYDVTGARQYSYPEFTDPKVYDAESDTWIDVVIPGKTVKVPGVLSDKNGDKNQNHLKYGQEYEYKSDVWRAWFGKRNNVENGNSCLKDADREALGVPMKRRMRGPWIVEMAGAMAAASANISRIIDWLKARLALRGMNRMNRSSAALFEPGLESLTVEEHDRRNPFNRLAEMEQLRLIA